MANWTCTVNIKQYLTNSDDDTEAQQVAQSIADELERARQEANGPLAVLACLGFPRFVKRLRRVRTTDGVNRVLSDLYDYGDKYRVWFA